MLKELIEFMARALVDSPEKVKVSTRGKESSERTIHDIIAPSFPAEASGSITPRNSCMRRRCLRARRRR